MTKGYFFALVLSHALVSNMGSPFSDVVFYCSYGDRQEIELSGKS